MEEERARLLKEVNVHKIEKENLEKPVRERGSNKSDEMFLLDLERAEYLLEKKTLLMKTNEELFSFVEYDNEQWSNHGQVSRTCSTCVFRMFC